MSNTISLRMHLMSLVFSFVSGQSKSHSGFCNPFIILKPLIIVHLMRMTLLVFFTLEHSEQALMDTNILLLCLHHPHSLLSHLEDNTENIYHIVFSYPLKK